MSVFEVHMAGTEASWSGVASHTEYSGEAEVGHAPLAIGSITVVVGVNRDMCLI